MIIESGLVKAGLVKTGLVRAISNINTRYFRRNESTTDYSTIPTVTLAGDFEISFDILTTSTAPASVILGSSVSATPNIRIDSSGFIAYALPTTGTGSIAVNDGVFHNIKVKLVGTLLTIDVDGVNDGSATVVPASITFDRLYRNTFGNYLAGILANLKIWDNGTLIRDYPLDDNSDDLRELASGQNGTVINGNASDWGLFQQQATGEWLGQELVVNGGFDTDSDWVKGANWSISGGTANAALTGNVLRQAISDFTNRSVLVVYDLVSISSGANVRAQFGGGQTAGKSVAGVYSEVITVVNNDPSLYLFGTAITASIDNVSVKEVLNVA